MIAGLGRLDMWQTRLEPLSLDRKRRNLDAAKSPSSALIGLLRTVTRSASERADPTRWRFGLLSPA